MRLWETQINFAVHCSTSGLGVSTEHLNAKQPLVRALYQISCVLSRPTHFEAHVDAFARNGGDLTSITIHFHLEEVRRIADEYGVSTKNLGIFKNKYYLRSLWHSSGRLLVRSITTGV